MNHSTDITGFSGMLKFDEIAKSQKSASIVIPAKAGIQVFQFLMDAGSKPAPDLIRGPA
jgi:hypothetical protein